MVTVSPPAILNVGPPGAGKTFALATLAASSKVEKLFYAFTDPGGDEALIDAFRHYNVPISKVHWHYIPAAAGSWSTLEDMTKKINMFDYESLSKMKAGIDKSGHRQFFDLLAQMNDFECQRTGKNYGPVDNFPPEFAIAYDSITGLNRLARETTVGAKPTLHQGEWGTAMALEESFVRKFVAGIKCPRVMISHLDQQRDELSGRVSFMPAFLGNKLAPQIPHLFSDVIFSYTEGNNFYWSTSDDRIALKTRNLKIGNKIEPDYRPLLEKWEARKEYAATIEVEEETTVSEE